MRAKVASSSALSLVSHTAAAPKLAVQLMAGIDSLRRADGDWAEVDQIVGTGKPLVRTQNALLYSLYKQREHTLSTSTGAST